MKGGNGVSFCCSLMFAGEFRAQLDADREARLAVARSGKRHTLGGHGDKKAKKKSKSQWALVVCNKVCCSGNACAQWLAFCPWFKIVVPMEEVGVPAFRQTSSAGSKESERNTICLAQAKMNEKRSIKRNKRKRRRRRRSTPIEVKR